MNIVVITAFLAALGVKQTAWILLRGTIFQGLRDTIADLEEKSYTASGIFVWGKLRELFGCYVCMTAQLSIWLVGVPATMLAYWAFGNPVAAIVGNPVGWAGTAFFTLLGTLMVSMAIAGLSTLFWHLTEYLPQAREDRLSLKNDVLDRVDEAMHIGQDLVLAAEDLASAATAASQAAQTMATNTGRGQRSSRRSTDGQAASVGHVEFTLDDADRLVTLMQRCNSVTWCGIERRECRATQMRRFLRAWAEQKGRHAYRAIDSLHPALTAMMREYYQIQHSGGTPRLAYLHQKHVVTNR